MESAKPARYTGDSMFDTKFTLVVLGIIVTIFFERIFKQEVTNWEAAGAVTSRGLRWAGLAAVAWAGAVGVASAGCAVPSTRGTKRVRRRAAPRSRTRDWFGRP